MNKKELLKIAGLEIQSLKADISVLKAQLSVEEALKKHMKSRISTLQNRISHDSEYFDEVCSEHTDEINERKKHFRGAQMALDEIINDHKIPDGVRMVRLTNLSNAIDLTITRLHEKYEQDTV